MKMGFEFTPEQQLVLAMEHLQDEVAGLKTDVQSHGGRIDGLAGRIEHLESLVNSLVDQIKLYAERRQATPQVVNWHRLTYDVAKGIGIAVGSSIALTVMAIFLLGLCVRIGGNSC